MIQTVVGKAAGRGHPADKSFRMRRKGGGEHHLPLIADAFSEAVVDHRWRQVPETAVMVFVVVPREK